jgi:hypothetical protein
MPSDDEPFALEWGPKGWIKFRDPDTGMWDAVPSTDVPGWKRVLVSRLRDRPRRQQEVDEEPEPSLACGCREAHEPCRFGLGLDCLNGEACSNPHHWGRGR